MNHTKYYIENYPRPMFVNGKWMSLNGKWDFLFDDKDEGFKNKYYKKFEKSLTINVPFSYQTKESGLEILDEHNIVWYNKAFDFSSFNLKNRLMLNFEGADYESFVWVNGTFVGKHSGGYTRFSFDITEEAKKNIKECVITVCCKDYKEAIQPRGKQTWLKEPFGCWYKETNGIWKEVWVEEVPEINLKNIKITPSITDYFTEFEIELNKFMPGYSLEILVTYKDLTISKTIVDLQRRVSNVKVDMNNDFDGFRVHYWDANCPNLYDVKFTLINNNKVVEEIGSYFGFRTFRAEGNCLLINNNPTYLKMILYQGYHATSGLTAPNMDALLKDLLLCKELGLNGIRMHQKIEDERFYYLADILGLYVWCEMPSPYEFKDNTIMNIVTEWMDVVHQMYNHPSIVAWVPINESWGVPRIVMDSTNKELAETLYHVTKAFDRYRPVISNDGWEQVTSDIVTLHNYAQKDSELTHIYSDMNKFLEGKSFVDYSQTRLPFAEGYFYKGQPVIVSEFAGIGYKNTNQDGWGYGDKVTSDAAYVERLTSLIKAIRAIDEVTGYCITQLTDVECEINGLFDIERKPKADIELLKKAIRG